MRGYKLQINLNCLTSMVIVVEWNKASILIVELGYGSLYCPINKYIAVCVYVCYDIVASSHEKQFIIYGLHYTEIRESNFSPDLDLFPYL